jgi:hypothetical protein
MSPASGRITGFAESWHRLEIFNWPTSRLPYGNFRIAMATSGLPTTQYDPDITLNSISNKASTLVEINQEAVSCQFIGRT